MTEAQGGDPVEHHPRPEAGTSFAIYRMLRGGVALILGVVYIWMGATWIITPTQTRLAGIEWAGLAGHYIGLWWIIGGVIAALGALFVKNNKFFGVALFSTIATPTAVAALFFISVFHGNLRGYITAGSYLPYGIISAYVFWVSARSQLASLKDQRVHTGALPIIPRGGATHG